MSVLPNVSQAFGQTLQRNQVDLAEGPATFFETWKLRSPQAEKSFQLTSAEESDYVYIFASPNKTDELCAPIETNSIYSCRKDQDIVLNFFRWQNGAVDFKNDMETYRIYLINHETGHILGWGHVGCPKEGAIAPVMMQQSKGTEGCIPYGWPAYETIKSKFDE